MAQPGSGDSLEKFLAFQREVNRLFRRIFEESNARELDAEGVPTRADVAERDEALVVEIETPGIAFDSLELSVSRDLIVVEGEKSMGDRPAGVRFHCMERSFGKFRRVVEIPVPVDLGGVSARYDAGVLSIVLPKIVADRRGERRKVPIQAASKPNNKRSKRVG